MPVFKIFIRRRCSLIKSAGFILLLTQSKTVLYCLQKADLSFGLGKCRFLRVILSRFGIFYGGRAVFVLDEFVGHFIFLFNSR